MLLSNMAPKAMAAAPVVGQLESLHAAGGAAGLTKVNEVRVDRP